MTLFGCCVISFGGDFFGCGNDWTTDGIIYNLLPRKRWRKTGIDFAVLKDVLINDLKVMCLGSSWALLSLPDLCSRVMMLSSIHGLRSNSCAVPDAYRLKEAGRSRSRG